MQHLGDCIGKQTTGVFLGDEDTIQLVQGDARIELSFADLARVNGLAARAVMAEEEPQSVG